MKHLSQRLLYRIPIPGKIAQYFMPIIENITWFMGVWCLRLANKNHPLAKIWLFKIYGPFVLQVRDPFKHHVRKCNHLNQKRKRVLKQLFKMK